MADPHPAHRLAMAASSDPTIKPFPTVRAALLAELERNEEPWLVEGLWMREAVGIIGGEPKCGKSFLALDLALAVGPA